ncbi:MFS transporter [Microbacterium gorillae]|uniref:MFS transporter n=1 Tax=Microbacterium gorillae TaxID=1231063 RepID=UPI00058BC4D1|nr:MFS transporter [Microbacterium gorillae]
MTAPVALDYARIQRRTVGVLAAGQILGGVAFGATVSLGALLARDITGEDALSGFATASVTLGAALAAIPLARLAAKAGRRFALTLGNLLALIGISIVITAAAQSVFALFIVGIVLIGMGNAGNLQSRFAATDLAEPARRGRDLSVVVWATTVGAVAGPLLLGPGEAVGRALGMPVHTGSYIFSLVAQVAAFLLYVIALRPDPLRTAQQRDATSGPAAVADRADRPRVARYAIFAVAASHAVMASVMAMTPIHLQHMTHGDATVIVGITIAAHVAGMYGLSPVFGFISDRFGRVRVILLGQLLLAGALVSAFIGGDSHAGVLVALVLLGLGWSAATVAGSALLTEASAPDRRPKRQGLSDSLMSLCAAVGAVLAGLVLAAVEYRGLALTALVLVVAVTALSPLALKVRDPQS